MIWVPTATAMTPCTGWNVAAWGCSAFDPRPTCLRSRWCTDSHSIPIFLPSSLSSPYQNHRALTATSSPSPPRSSPSDQRGRILHRLRRARSPPIFLPPRAAEKVEIQWEIKMGRHSSHCASTLFWRNMFTPAGSPGRMTRARLHSADHPETSAGGSLFPSQTKAEIYNKINHNTFFQEFIIPVVIIIN